MSDEESLAAPDPTLPGVSARHYPTLDGMRGIAVLFVLMFHAFLGAEYVTPRDQSLSVIPAAGWLGVDVFFVLSGFLITGILLDSKRSPHYFRNFYARRTVRIFPLYYLVLAVIFGVLPLLVPFSDPGLKLIQHNQGWFWAYLTNIGFIAQKKAFADAQWLDLNHLWSLAVEEQFYLVWPLLVWLLSRRNLAVLCWACVIGSFALRVGIWLSGMRTGAIYYPTPCRLDGLAVGALLALSIRNGPWPTIAPRRWKPIGIIAIAGLCVVALLRGKLAFADGPAIVFGVSCVVFASAGATISAIRPNSLITRTIGIAPLRWVGRYSYGIYVFHSLLRPTLLKWFPDEELTRVAGSVFGGRVLFCGIFLTASILAAYVSWHVYEKHWLRLKKRFDYIPAPARPAISSRIA